MAFAAISKAKSLEGNASAPEREYIDALAERYASDGKMTDALQLAYANAMREVARQNPDDPDAGTLFAESMMDLHPWGLWTLDGKPVDGTPEIVATLEGVIAKYPEHLGANHYYIHAVEASPDPGRALASAQRLPSSRQRRAISCICRRTFIFASVTTTRPPSPTKRRLRPTRFTCASAVPRACIRRCTSRTTFNSYGPRT